MPSYEGVSFRHRGFTYVGLLILIAIIGISAVATVSVGQVVQQRSAEEELLYVGSQYRDAFKSYYEATPLGQARYPRSLDELVLDRRFPRPVRHLRRVFVDPLTGNSDWTLIASMEGGIMGVSSKSPRTPIKVSNFPQEWSQFEGKKSYAEWQFAFIPFGASVPLGAPR